MSERLTKQKDVFYNLRRNFSDIYNKLEKYNIAQFVLAQWREHNTELEKTFLPYPPFSFLKNPIMKKTMVPAGNWWKKELRFLKKKFKKEELKQFLEEDLVGSQEIVSSKYDTSCNNIHHLYHLVRFLETTKCDLDKIDAVIDWGGGYGNMAKMFSKFKSATYIIIDIPIFSCIQWLYLASIGKDVNLFQAPKDQIQKGKINILPVCFLKEHELKADLFISTWALSESSKYSQDYVIARKWFDARHILLAYQDNCREFPDAERIGKIARNVGAVIEDIEFLAGNHYALL